MFARPSQHFILKVVVPNPKDVKIMPLLLRLTFYSDESNGAVLFYSAAPDDFSVIAIGPGEILRTYQQALQECDGDVHEQLKTTTYPVLRQMVEPIENWPLRARRSHMQMLARMFQSVCVHLPQGLESTLDDAEITFVDSQLTDQWSWHDRIRKVEVFYI